MRKKKQEKPTSQVDTEVKIKLTDCEQMEDGEKTAKENTYFDIYTKESISLSIKNRDRITIFQTKIDLPDTPRDIYGNCAIRVHFIKMIVGREYHIEYWTDDLETRKKVFIQPRM